MNQSISSKRACFARAKRTRVRRALLDVLEAHLRQLDAVEFSSRLRLDEDRCRCAPAGRRRTPPSEIWLSRARSAACARWRKDGHELTAPSTKSSAVKSQKNWCTRSHAPCHSRRCHMYPLSKQRRGTPRRGHPHLSKSGARRQPGRGAHHRGHAQKTHHHHVLDGCPFRLVRPPLPPRVALCFVSYKGTTHERHRAANRRDAESPVGR